MIKKSIKKKVFNLLVEKEEPTDGGLESLLKIIKYYKGDVSTIKLHKVVENNFPLTSINSLIKTAAKCGLYSEVLVNVNIDSLINYNQPLIIGTTTINCKTHYVVCYSYSKEKGFLIWDSRNGSYNASIEGLKSLWKEEICIAFRMN